MEQQPQKLEEYRKRKALDLIHDLQLHLQYLDLSNPLKEGSKYLDYEFEQCLEEISKRKEYNLPCVASKIPVNVDKNRYPDVLPPDSTRVELKPIPGCEGSDYINANFINNMYGKKKYICTQGPLDNTVNDFWRLVWEHQINVFAMLTKEVEKGQVKSSRYWPDLNCVAKYGSIDVKLTYQQQQDFDGEVIYRKMIIRNIDERQEPREIKHFQYVGWPDHGLPPSCKQFIQLMDLVDSHVPASGIIGLHCSAGIGRTGTFTTVHMIRYVLQKHYQTSTDPLPFNIIQVILNQRKQRPGMVQTKEQFLFCYQAILVENLRLYNEAKARKAATSTTTTVATTNTNGPNIGQQ